MSKDDTKQPAKSFEERSFRNIMMTINNYSEEEYGKVVDYKQARYVVVGKEIGEKCKTPHLQIYMELKNSTKGSTLKNAFPRANIQERRGTQEQAATYCKKGGDFLELGEMKKQGARTDLLELKDKILAHQLTAEDIAVEDPKTYSQYGRTLHKLEEIAMRKRFRTWKTKGLWLYGPSGTGKSHHWKKDYNPETDYLYDKKNRGWWDGYTGQERVIIDEFRGGDIDFATILQLMDDIPYTVPRKCIAPFPFLAKEVIITSPLHPREIFTTLHVNDSMAQLERRCEIRYVGPNTKIESRSDQRGNTVPSDFSESPRELL